MSNLDILLPGALLVPAGKATPGPGTHIQNNQITASVLGRASTAKSSLNSTTRSKGSTSVSVLRPASRQTAPVLPSVGAQVYAKVTSLQRQQATCSIHALVPPSAAALPRLDSDVSSTPTEGSLEPRALATSFRGIIRSQDVRATEKDKVKLGDCFRVGDVVRAVVISLGDQGGYYLSTAGNEYGVVIAWSEAGNGCVPVSWREVLDEKTGLREARKVAKPI
ncbi:hypothetical protein BT63DRAFT_459541 [Microthyrium microscopicum]|uniref:Uncharacterized protein n=1 Tax=Microthyrium microscopicum TaxID=703497 RepID=A0A6A6U0Y5_9PEZI|nr:hypothetical protein BT63DRAFT_459541 [Microthyrium microscopicum]